MKSKTYENDSKLLRFYTENSVKCSCGHSIFIGCRKNKAICGWCGKAVYKTKKDEFKDRLLQSIRRVKNK